VRRVVVTDQVLRSLVLNKELRESTPIFKIQANPRGVSTSGCSKCRKRKKLTNVSDVNFRDLKRKLYESDSATKQKVKDKLGADKLVFYFLEPGLPQRVVV